MRYSLEFKLQAIELYNQGKWPPTPSGVKLKTFHNTVAEWKKIFDNYGKEALAPKSSKKKWTPEEKLKLIEQVQSGEPIRVVALAVGIRHGTIHAWLRKYQEEGYNGLKGKIGKPSSKPKEPSDMEKYPESSTPSNEDEHAEILRLRAEIAYLKKSEALRHERFAAQLKAKKRQLSQSSDQKDIV